MLKLLPEKKKGEVGIGIGDPPVRGTEGPISWQASLLREVICFPEGWVGNVMGKLSALVQPLDYYPLLLSHVGKDEVCNMKAKDDQKGFQGLGTLGYHGIRSMSSVLIYPSSCREW